MKVRFKLYRIYFQLLNKGSLIKNRVVCRLTIDTMHFWRFPVVNSVHYTLASHRYNVFLVLIYML